MKIRTCAALLIAAMMLVLTGCGLQAAEERLSAAEETAQNQAEATESAVREAVLPQPEPQDPVTLAANASSAAAEPTLPAEETQVVETLPPAPSVHTAALTKEEAEAIALKHAGFTENQVSYLRTEYDLDHRIPEYDVEFREGRWEYEYEIHAETGTILSFEKDD